MKTTKIYLGIVSALMVLSFLNIIPAILVVIGSTWFLLGTFIILRNQSGVVIRSTISEMVLIMLGPIAHHVITELKRRGEW